MSFSGLRKQFNKANQYLSETMGAAEPTKLDETFNEMEKKIDCTNELITYLIAGTHEYLQPNPATRAKMATMGAVSKLRGTTKTSPYPQTEGMLAETMQKYGRILGDESDLGKALVDASEAYRQMADIKYQMEDTVKHNFLDPLTHLQNNELKDVLHHRTKLKGRRLDYDCKKRKQTRDEELIQAEEKLEESKKLAEMAMYNVLNNDVEQISQLCALVDAQLDFHRQTTQMLEGLQIQLKSRVEAASCRPRQEHCPKPVLENRTPRSSSLVIAPPTVSSSISGSGATTASGTTSSTSTFPFGILRRSSAKKQKLDRKVTISSPIDPTASSMPGSDAPPAYSSSPAHVNGAYPQAGQQAGPLPPKASPSATPQKPSAKALFDFTAENEGELEMKEGEIVELISQIDENWYEGRVGGRTGLFPISYVQVLVPIK